MANYQSLNNDKWTLRVVERAEPIHLVVLVLRSLGDVGKQRGGRLFTPLSRSCGSSHFLPIVGAQISAFCSLAALSKLFRPPKTRSAAGRVGAAAGGERSAKMKKCGQQFEPTEKLSLIIETTGDSWSAGGKERDVFQFCQLKVQCTRFFNVLFQLVFMTRNDWFSSANITFFLLSSTTKRLSAMFTKMSSNERRILNIRPTFFLEKRNGEISFFFLVIFCCKFTSFFSPYFV